MKKRRVCIRWTAEEMAFLQESWESRVPIDEIASRLHRSESAIRERLRRMGVKRSLVGWV